MTFPGQHAIACGDVLPALRSLPDCSIDGALFDPPYGLGNHQPTRAELIAFLQGSEMDTGGDFMGKDWHVPSLAVWCELLRVLKPGAPLVCFGGSRTFPLLALGMWAAGLDTPGLELRDCLSWMYGSGFPKSLNVGKALAESMAEATKDPSAPTWGGYGTALKPAWEPALLARKPLEGTVAHNVATWGVGALAIDACRIEGTGNVTWSTPRGGICLPDPAARGELLEAGGRWPANVILDEEAGALLDAQAGNRPSTPYRENVASGDVLPLTKRTAGGYSDDGGPSRFFYCAKVSKREREHGCAALPMRSAGEVTGGREEGSAGLSNPRAGAGRGGGSRNHHPTLKPIALTQWLARLLLPPPRADGRPPVLLVPYSGAGSEMIGALRAGWGAVFGIERDPEYVAIANARIEAWRAGEP